MTDKRTIRRIREILNEPRITDKQLHKSLRIISEMEECIPYSTNDGQRRPIRDIITHTIRGQKAVITQLLAEIERLQDALVVLDEKHE